MFLIETSEQAKTRVDEESLYYMYKDIIKSYLHERLSQDKEKAAFNKVHLNERALLKQAIIEDGISLRRIDSAYAFYRSAYARDPLPSEKIIEYVWSIIQNKLYTSESIDRYHDATNLIDKYILLRIRQDKEKKEFRTTQKHKLKVFREEATDNGFIPAMLNNIYTDLKLTIKNFKDMQISIENYYSDSITEFADIINLAKIEVFEEIINV